jgi:O-antigen/teichoic acid export membrane protein/SAM-dependent methyltransferase
MGVAGRLLRDSTVYLIGNLLQKATAFVLLPIYTNYLTTLQYGLLELANTVVNLTLVTAALGVPYAINKCYHRDCPDEASRQRLASTALVFSVLTAGGLALAGWAFEDALAGIIFSSPEGLLVYRYTLVWLVLAQVATIPFELLRATGRSYGYLGISVVQLAVQSVLIVYLVRFAGAGLRGVLIGNVAGFVAVNGIAAVLLARQVSWHFDRTLLRAMIAYGLAMIPVFLSGWVVGLSDRFILNATVGLGALGVYALGYKFGTLVSILLGIPLQRAWTPIFFSIADREQAPRRLAQVATYFTLAGMFCSLAISLSVTPFLRLTAAPEFHGAAAIVPIVCFAYIVSGLANCLANGLIVAGQVRLMSLYAAAAAASNLLLNVLLIPWLGIFGAASAAVLAFAAQLGGTVRSLGRHYPVPLEWGRIGGVVLAGAAPYALSYAPTGLSFAADAGFRLLLLGAFPVLLLALGVVRPGELAAIREGIGLRRKEPVDPAPRPDGGPFPAAVERARRRCLDSLRSDGDPARAARAGAAIDYHLREYRTVAGAAPDDPVRTLTAPLRGDVLEVGCGFGQVLLALGDGAEGARLFGVDRDRDVVRFGSLLCRELGSSRLLPRLVTADALRLPFPDRRFDLVICRDVLMALPAGRGIAEMARLLRPGGRLYIHEVGAGFYLDEIGRGYWKGALLALFNGVLLQIASRQISVAGLWNNFQSRRFLGRALRREGLVVTRFARGRTRLGLPLNVKVVAARPELE